MMIKTLIIVRNENDEIKLSSLLKNKLLFSIRTISDENVNFKIIRKLMRDEKCSRIVFFNSDMSRFDVFLKSNSVWTKLNFENLIFLWFRSNNFKIKRSYWNTPKIYKNDGKKLIDLKFPLNLNEINEGLSILNWLLDENSLSGLNDSEHYLSIYTTAQGDFKLKSKLNYDKFKDKLLEGIEDLKTVSIKLIDQEKIYIKTKNGEIFVEKTGEDNINFIITVKGKKSSDIYFLLKAYKNNLKAYINNEIKVVGKTRKVNYKDLVTSIISMIVIIILFYITFNFVFEKGTSGAAFNILTNKYTWSNIWIYLIIVNFIFSLFLGMIMSLVVQWFSPNTKKINYKNVLNMWVSLQIRTAVAFITTNAFIATFVWGLYIVKTTRMKTIGFVGMVASVSMLRAMIMMPIGFIFMIRGTLYNQQILSEMGNSSAFIIYSILSWGGWIWTIIHNLSISLFIILPPLHIFYNKILEGYHNKFGTLDDLTDSMTSFEMQLKNIKSNLPKQFKNYKRIFRLALIIIISIVIETFEFTFILKMVENYNLNVQKETFEAANYNNVFAISSVRYVSSFVHHFPILNIIPGQGLGISDKSLNDMTYAIVASKHQELNNYNFDLIDDISSESTLIIRFFNFYLKKIIALLITISFIIKYTLFRKNK